MRPHSRVIVFALALVIAGCDSPQSYMGNTAGPAAQQLASLGWQALLAFGAATLITWGLILWVALRRRGTLAEHAPIDANHGQAWILIGGVAVPFVVLAVLFISMLDSLAAFPIHHSSEANQPDIRLTGQQWWFEAEYGAGPGSQVFVPTEIYIPVGRPIDIELQTRDVIHSFWIPKLHGKVDLVPGILNRIRIIASRPGTYEGQCAEYCGMQHALMRLRVIALPEQEYATWLAHQREPASEPTTDAARHGREVFMSAACPLCHTVRGTGAHGRLGPDLTHLASRNRIAGGAFRNDTANLQAWITHAQSMKPGSRMPNLTEFSGADLQALSAYLQSLR